MKIINLGSGSKGNCTYIETKESKILIDCGIAYNQVKSYLNDYHINLDLIDAIFVSHEHTDHISNLVTFLSKTKATLYIKEETFSDAEYKLKTSLKCYPHEFIESNLLYNIKDISVLPIRLSHDTRYCMGFVLRDISTDNNITFASITDTGYIPEEYYKVLSFVNTLLIESNHDVTLLQNSGRPYFLINRILSDNGHMSNVQCAHHLKKIVSKHTKHVILAHLSEECNEPSIALNTIKDEFNNELPFTLDAAYQYKTIMYDINGD